jgi:chromosome segregation ATPase
MKLYKYLIIILPLLIWSCKDQEKSTYLQEIEVMTTKLDSLNVVSNNQKNDSISYIVQTVEKTIDRVKKNYIADTINLEIAALMNRYKDAKKSLSSNTGNLAKAKDAIPEVQEKLKDLKHDIENGVGDRDKYQEYFDFEKSKIKEIESILNYYTKTNKKYMKQFQESDPKVQNFADSLEIENAK